MRVLWIINMVLPQVAKEIGIKTSVSGGWLVDYANKLGALEGTEIATMTYAGVQQDMDVTVGGIRNFIFAGGGKRLLFDSPQTIKDCEKVLQEFKPDVIHLHGTEYSVGAAMLKVNKKYNIPVLLTIQGILSRISQEYYGGLSFAEICKMTTFKEFLKLKTPFFVKRLFLHNAKRERKVLNQVKYVTGRTAWDKSVMLAINPDLHYYRFNYNLREEFYSAPKWKAEEMQPHTVLIGASSYPLKGMHVILDALMLLKKKYPDVKILVPGAGYRNGKPVRLNGYQRYIAKKIRKNGLENHVEFLGGQSAAQIAELLRHVNACVVTSAMEGASATICEAMMVGTPAVCTYRGGMTDMLRDGQSGFYYDFPEYSVLADRLSNLFDDVSLCERFSAATIADAEKRHNRDVNFAQLLEIYQEVILKESGNRETSV